jgi:hypothetical protein
MEFNLFNHKGCRPRPRFIAKSFFVGYGFRMGENKVSVARVTKYNLCVKFVFGSFSHVLST